MAKRVSIYGMLTALCLIFGYLESLVSLSFIAPGIKLGIANSIALLLILKRDYKGAFSVNITRMLISALLFSTPFSLLFSMTAGILSMITMMFISKFKNISAVGFSICGAVVHNTVQLSVASIIFGNAVWYYLPVLLVSAAISGTAIGLICNIILKKLKTNLKL